MLSRSLIKFTAIVQASSRLGRLVVPATSNAHLDARPSTIENARYLSFTAVESQKGQSLCKKTSTVGDREMLVDLIYSQQRGHEFFVRRSTNVSIDAIPAFTDLLESIVGEYNKIK